MLAPLVIASDTVLGVASNILRWYFLVTTWGHLPACLCRVVCGHLVVGGMLGGDVTWVLERAPKEVALAALPRALPIATGHPAWAAQVGLATSLGLIAPSLPRPY
jgi:hypothetical protein